MNRKYLEIVRSRWLLLVLGVAVAMIAAYVVNQTTPPRYESTVRLIAGQAAQSGLTYSGLLADQEVAKTYAQLATARPVLDAVILRLQLDTNAELLGRQVRVNLIPETRLIDVTVTSESPEGSAAIANAIAEELGLLSAAGAQGTETAVRQNILEDIQALRQLTTQAEQELIQLNQQLSQAEASGTDTTALLDRRNGVQENLSRWHTTLATLYDTLLETTGTNVRVIAPAAAPTRPTSPGLGLTLAVAGLVGLILATGVALAQDFLDDTVRTPARLPTDERMPFLGSVPRFARPRRRLTDVLLGRGKASAADALVARRLPQSAAAESYRAVRTALRGLTSATRPQVLLVTSARPGEGKTTTVANLGVLLAQMGRRVVLVDTDLRNPSLHLLFEMSNTSGLSNALRSDETALSPNLLKTGVDGLRLLPSGPPVVNTAELLASGRMELLLMSLLGSHDVVLFDTPPVLSVTDAAVLAPRADYVLLVVGAGLSQDDEIVRARDILLATSAEMAGVVLTKAELPFNRSYGYYGTYGNADRRVIATANGTESEHDTDGEDTMRTAASGTNGANGADSRERPVSGGFSVITKK